MVPIPPSSAMIILLFTQPCSLLLFPSRVKVLLRWCAAFQTRAARIAPSHGQECGGGVALGCVFGPIGKVLDFAFPSRRGQSLPPSTLSRPVRLPITIATSKPPDSKALVAAAVAYLFPLHFGTVSLNRFPYSPSLSTIFLFPSQARARRGLIP